MVVIILLLSSWFLSMYVTPAMCFWFMKVKPIAGAQSAGGTHGAAEEAYATGFYRIYRALLEGLLILKVIVSAAAVLAIVLGVLIASQLVRKFFGPSTDRNQFLIYVDLPVGYNIESTNDTMRRLSSWLASKDINPEVDGTIAYVGFGGHDSSWCCLPCSRIRMSDSWSSIPRTRNKYPY